MELKSNYFNEYAWIRYSDYEIKKIDNIEYILPTKSSTISNYEPFENMESLLVELLDIGRLANRNDLKNNLQDVVLSFVKKYGLLGIETSWKNSKYYEEHFDEIYNKDYKEQLSDFVDYTKHEYNVLIDYLNLETTKSGDLEITDYFKIKEAELFIMTDGTLRIKWKLSSLRQAIDLYSSVLISQHKDKLRICKHCSKAFIAKNPKTEYCSFQCKNQSNVYKSRNKNK